VVLFVPSKNSDLHHFMRDFGNYAHNSNFGKDNNYIEEE
jgi:hypothetical protein